MPARRPANDVRDTIGESLQRVDLGDEVTLKRAEERIAHLKGEPNAGRARWLLRRLRRRLFGNQDQRPA